MIAPQEYKAPKPRYSSGQWCKYITARVVFCPILLWDLVKFVGKKSLGAYLGKKILPAQDKDFKPLIQEVNEELNGGAFPFKKYTLITHDGARLDTLELKYPSRDMPSDKYIIYFVGNEMCYENIFHEMKMDVKSLKVNAIGFNFRGVGNSSGRATSSNQLVIDGIAQVNRLLDQGVSSHNIILKGHSLGAGIASFVALYFHNQANPIYIFNGRSFASLTIFIVGRIRLGALSDKITSTEEKPEKKILGWVAKPFVKTTLLITGWEIDAIWAFKKIPLPYREYLVIKDKKGQPCFDDIIPHYSSIYKALASERQLEMLKLNKKLNNINKLIANSTDEAIKNNLLAERQVLTTAINTISGYKMTPRNSIEQPSPHQARLSYLFAPSGLNGEVLFMNFVYRVNPKAELKAEAKAETKIEVEELKTYMSLDIS